MPVRIGIMLPSRETAMTSQHDARGARADDELDQYLRAYYGQPLDVMRHVQAIRGGSVEECLDWLARYVDAGARHLILRIGSLTARPESVAEQLLPALKEIGSP